MSTALDTRMENDNIRINTMILSLCKYDSLNQVTLTDPGGALNFFSGRGVRPGFPKCGACELTFASEKGGL